ASFEVSGRLARGLDRFELAAKSERFDLSPVAALFPGIVKGAVGEGRLDVRSRGRLLRGVLVPGTLELEGVAGVRGAEIRFPGSPEFGVRADGTLTLAGRVMSAPGLRLETKVLSPGSLGAYADLGTISFGKLDLALRAAPPGVTTRFDARSSDFDVGALFAAVGAAPSTTSGSEDPLAIPRWLVLHGRLAVDRASVWPGRAALEELACGIQFEAGSLRLEEAVARIWGGLLSCEATVDLTGPRPRTKGNLSLNDVDLIEAAKAASIPGALEGTGGLSLLFEGEGLGRLDFERNWQLDVEGRTSEVALAAARWPLAREVRAALERVAGIDPPRPLGQAGPPKEPDLRPRPVGQAGPPKEPDLRPRPLGQAGPPKEPDLRPRPVGQAGPPKEPDLRRRDAKARSKPVVIKVAVRRGRTTMESTDFEFEDGLRLGMSGRTELDGRIAAWVTVRRLPDRAGVPGDRLGLVEELVRRGALRFAVTGTWARPVVDVEGLLRWILPSTRGGAADDGGDAGAPSP
ncbi:MAG: AsmA family protein, partial [Planctomycetota bacterium]